MAGVLSMLVLGYQQITNLTASVGLDVPDDCHFALIQAETQNVRWTDDGTTPTAAIGMILIADTNPVLFNVQDLQALRFIQTAATAKLNVSYYGN